MNPPQAEAPIEVGRPRPTAKSGKTADPPQAESSDDALQKKKHYHGGELGILLLFLLVAQYPISEFL